MPLTKAKGNMYPWVTHTHSLLAGACPHGCRYCYVQAMARKFANLRARYTGPVRLVEEEFSVDYNAPAVWKHAKMRGFERPIIFIEHLNDLFAAGVTSDIILTVLKHTRKFPNTTFVFQTKNPSRIVEFFHDRLPSGSCVGTTIETNRHLPKLSSPVPPFDRAAALGLLPNRFERFVTVEPILDFDLPDLLSCLTIARPNFINIGADSKGHGLPEPSREKLQLLLNALAQRGIEVRQKTNLKRLLN